MLREPRAAREPCCAHPWYIQYIYSLKKVLCACSKPQLFVDLLIELGTFVLQLATACGHTRVRTLKQYD
jgi:hypothetical protein